MMKNRTNVGLIGTCGSKNQQLLSLNKLIFKEHKIWMKAIIVVAIALLPVISCGQAQTPSTKIIVNPGGYWYNGDTSFLALNYLTRDSLGKFLFDEQANVDPKNTPTSPNSYYPYGLNAQYNPISQYVVDLGGSYSLTDIYYYDRGGSDSGYIWTGTPTNWQLVKAFKTGTVTNAWVDVPTTALSRYVMIQIGVNSKLSEVVLYGTLQGSLMATSPSTSTSYTLPTYGNMMGITADGVIPPALIQGVGSNVRYYENQSWMDTNTVAHNIDQLKFVYDLFSQNPNYVKVQFPLATSPITNYAFPKSTLDSDYFTFKKQNQTLFMATQGFGLFEVNGNNPIDSLEHPNGNPSNPACYDRVARMSYYLGGILGNGTVTPSSQVSYPGTFNTNAATEIEDGNEMDGTWVTPQKFTTIPQYFAYSSMYDDGNGSPASSRLGIKNAAPGLKHILAGTFYMDSVWIKGLKYMSYYYRPDHKMYWDVFNFHYYSEFDTGLPDGHALDPEEDSVRSKATHYVQFLHKVNPAAKVYWTEWGFDRNSKSWLHVPDNIPGADSATVQAQWIIREWLAIGFTGVDVSTMFQFQNDPTQAAGDKLAIYTFNSTGLVSFYQPAPLYINQLYAFPSYYYVRSLFSLLGNYRADSVVRERPGDSVWIYRYRNASISDSVIDAVWCPTKTGKTLSAFQVKVSVPGQIVKMVQFANLSVTGNFSTLTANASGYITIPVSENPTFILYKDTTAIVIPVFSMNLTGSTNGTINTLTTTLKNTNTIKTVTLQRSANNASFTGLTTIGTAPITPGNSTYTDATPLSGPNYYRLAATDTAGNVSYSDTVYLNIPVVVTPPSVPVANAGSNVSIQLPIDSTLLSGASSTDVGGTITTYGWSILSGPATYAFTSKTTEQTTLTDLVAGTYQVVLTVTDNKGNSAKDTMDVVVNPPTIVAAPVAVISASAQTITLPADSIFLSGLSSTAASGSTISDFKWTVISGPSQYALVGSSTDTSLLASLASGTYKVALTVTDNQGLSSSDTVSLVVNPKVVLIPPTAAIAASSVSVTLPADTVFLSGLTSTAPAGATLTGYQWKVISGPTPYTVGGTGADTSLLSNLSSGSYTVSLTVTDNQGMSSSDTISLTVNPPVIVAGPVAIISSSAQAITLPSDSIFLSGLSSTAALGSTITDYQWKVISGPSSYSLTGSSADTSFLAGLASGTYKVALTVTDNQGLTGADTISLTVNPKVSLIAPQAVITASSATITLPADSVFLSGLSSTAPTGASLTGYQWKVISGPSTYTLGASSGDTSILTGLTAGTYKVALTVSDDQGLSNADTVSLTVLAPVITAGPQAVITASTSTLTLPSDSVFLSGLSSSAPTGASLTAYQWKVISGPSTYTMGGSSSDTSFLGSLTMGTYKIALTVTDNQGLSGSDTVSLTVLAPAIVGAPQAIITPSSLTVALPTDSVFLSGLSSTAPQGDALTGYKWTMMSGPSQYSLGGSGSDTMLLGNLAVGTYQVILTVTDNQGQTASDTVAVTVLVNPNKGSPVAIISNSDTTVNLPDSNFVLNGSDSYAPTGQTLTGFLWQQLAGPQSVQFSDSTGANTGLSFAQSGSYLFQLTVTDDLGQQNATSVVINVDQKKTALMKIYPNPVGQNLNVWLGAGISGRVSFSIYDESGRLVMANAMTKQPEIEQTQTMNVQQLAQGAYFLKMDSDQHKITLKFMKGVGQ